MKVDGDWSRYQTRLGFTTRLAKQDDASMDSSVYRGGYYGDEECHEDDTIYYDDESGSSWDEGWYDEHWSDDDYNINYEDDQWNDEDFNESDEYYGGGKRQ